MAWIKANPGDAAALSVQHLRSYLFPSPWQFQYKGSGSFALPRAALVWLISLLGLAWLAAKLRRPGYGYLALMVVVPALTYVPFQPMPQYIYLSYGMLAFLASGLLIEARRFVALPSLARARS